MSFAGNQYPNFADKVISTRGDIIRGDSSGDRERYGIGAANTVLTSDGSDPAWAAAALAPTTTKGDLSGFSTTQARIPISTNNYTLLGDSAQALGLKWAPSATSTLSTTGDLLYASGANTLQRLASTTSGHVLTAQGAGVAPVWAAAGGDPDMKYLASYALTSANHVLEASNIFGDYDVIWIEYYLEEASTQFDPFFNVYQTGGGLASSTGFQESINYGASASTAGGSDLPIDANAGGTANTSIGSITLINGNATGTLRYGGGFASYQMMVAGTSNAPAGVGNLNFKLNNTTQMIGIKFYNGTGTDLLATDSYFSVWVGHDIS